MPLPLTTTRQMHLKEADDKQNAAAKHDLAVTKEGSEKFKWHEKRKENSHGVALVTDGIVKVAAATPDQWKEAWKHVKLDEKAPFESDFEHQNEVYEERCACMVFVCVIALH
jgi:hypothetical protein